MGNDVPSVYSALPLAVATSLADSLGRASELLECSHAPATRAAYSAAVDNWAAWATSHGVAVWPTCPGALATYIGHLERAGRSVATISLCCAALADWHRQNGHFSPTDDPTIRRLMRGLRKAHAGRQTAKKAFTPDVIRHFVAHESTSARDRALIAVGFVTGLRRSELVALQWSDLADCPDSAGLTLFVRRSKADQDGKGAYVAVPRGFGEIDPAGLLLTWRGLTDGERIFPISVDTVLRVAKRVATLAGLEPADYGAHSLRAGLCTVAARAGVSLAESMQASRHKSADVAAKYVGSIEASSNRAHKAAADALNSK